LGNRASRAAHHEIVAVDHFGAAADAKDGHDVG
jgi:hypothetical protein